MTLARFTPSILDGETLEQLFVHRHHLLDDVMEAVQEAAETDGRRHRLFVGPRGAGKTHLISLVNHRVAKARADGLRVGVSWLEEDPWEIANYDDFIGQILLEATGNPNGATGERALLDLVQVGGPIVTLVENLDQVLLQIGRNGQRRLRALLENTRALLLVATSTRLAEAMAAQVEPFYGFFDTTYLKPFDVEQAADMLRQVAKYSENHELAELLESEQINARLATIAHLAGGQPRVWNLLATGLTASGIDNMVDMLLARFDDLTPYYQEQLARLAPSERKAVRRLSEADRPLRVGELANATQVSANSMSKTISDLRKKGWVRPHQNYLTRNMDSRHSYFVLAEPLARIAFQMKASRGQPVRIAVDFLANWFSADELSGGSSERSDPYRRSATETANVTQLVHDVLSASTVPRETGSETLQVLENLDRALAVYGLNGDTVDLLALPASIGDLMAHMLAEEEPELLRLRLIEHALRAGKEHYWRQATEDLMGQEALAELPLLDAFYLAGHASSESSPDLKLVVDRLDDKMGFLEDPPLVDLLAFFNARLRAGNVHDSYVKYVLDMQAFTRPGVARPRANFTLVAVAMLGNQGKHKLATVIAERELDSARIASDEALAIVNVALAVVHILARDFDLAVGRLSQAKALTSSNYVYDLVGIAETEIGRGSHADGVPDGLGLGEGLEAGEAGVGEP